MKNMTNLKTNDLLESLEVSPELQTSSKDRFFEKIISEIYSKKDIEVKTDLNDKQIISFSRGKIFSKIYGVPLVDKLTDHIAVYSVSKKRLSRKEFTDIVRNVSDDVEVSGIKQRLLGE